MNDTLKERTEKFALDVIVYSDKIPENIVGKVIKYQLVKAGTSVGANYRAVIRAKSSADFINKLKIVEEEADESVFWLNLIEKSKVLESSETGKLISDADEILRMVVSSIKTAKQKERDY